MRIQLQVAQVNKFEGSEKIHFDSVKFPGSLANALVILETTDPNTIGNYTLGQKLFIDFVPID